MSGGGGRSRTFSGRKPGELWKQVQKAEEKTSEEAFDTIVAETLGNLLAEYNDRDSELVAERLENIKSSIQGEIESSVDTLYGGSVAKHTYVDGLSDIDSFIILNKTDLADKKPIHILKYIKKILDQKFKGEIQITPGNIAITAEYPDGMKIQLLPAINKEKGLKIPAWKSNTWADIDPEKFRSALSKRNLECNNKLVPTIKLVKAINATIPEEVRLTGYHIESLAISAFKDYKGPKLPGKMIMHFFERAKDLVLSPMKDKTGQSVHVDEYLGNENSENRQQVSHMLSRTAKRIRNAITGQSVEMLASLFE